MPLSIADFVHRWKIVSQTENAVSQTQFIDLCEVLGQPHPAAADSAGENYAFEKYVGKTRGGKGFADIWFRDHFAWEYKGKSKNLQKAYDQLNDYREELGNPPLLVVSDMETFQVHTNFTATAKRVYQFSLDDLLRNQVTATCPLPPLEVLRALFGDYNVLRPERTDAQVTQDIAKKFARLAERLELEDRALGATREQVAHFLMRVLFCLFADSIGLLPDHVFRRMIQQDRFLPRKFLRKLENLFAAMSDREGIFGEYSIRYFNGDLFNSSAVMQLDLADLGVLYDVSKNYDWAHVAPAIFGTLFERSLDPKRRSLIGAHYTSEEDIRTLIEPVVMRPLLREWSQVKGRVQAAVEAERAEEASSGPRQIRLRTDRPSEKILSEWIDKLTAIRILDPACGSGNFLYVALRRLLDLWLEAREFAAGQGISLVLPNMVSPSQLYGIETEFYAHELASVVVWIGFLQWKHEHGILEDREPILEKLTNIEHGDAILRYDADGKPYEPEWPRADFVVGNPPFVGDKKMRRELGDEYVETLRELYEDRVPGGADLVTYWFEKSRALLEERAVRAAGLVATQAIRGGVNREVLARIAESGGIFMAWSDRDWINEGAEVHISIVGFDTGEELEKTLNGERVESINNDLTSGTDTTRAKRLKENAGIAFQGPVKVGKFEMSREDGLRMLSIPNPHLRPNSDVLKPWMNGQDMKYRPKNRWIIDFGDLTEGEAAMYEAPFEFAKTHVLPKRENNRDEGRRENWWRLGRSGEDLRKAKSGLERIIVTQRTSKHRLFAWAPSELVPDSAMVAITRPDDYFFGILHSSLHEVWSRAQGTQLREVESGFRYTPNSTFDTFPFPWSPGQEPSEEANPRVRAIAAAARELVRLRDAWLNPPGIDPRELPKRTLTNLYSQNPQWLQDAHRVLDEAVFAAYGWPVNLPRDEILSRLLVLNHERAAAQSAN